MWSDRLDVCVCRGTGECADAETDDVHVCRDGGVCGGREVFMYV